MLLGTEDGVGKLLRNATNYRTTILDISDHRNIVIHSICNFKSHNAYRLKIQASHRTLHRTTTEGQNVQVCGAFLRELLKGSN
jgi:hypothetical protein